MESCYYLLLCTDDTTAPELELHPFNTYSELWQYLQDRLFLDRLKWYKIYWGDTQILSRVLF